MSLIHPQSCECAKSELDLFVVPPTQTSIEGGDWIEYNPISSIADGVPIEFQVLGNGDSYLDVNSTQIYVKAEIVQANGAAIDNTHHVAPVNLLLHALFSEVDVKLNDTIVSSTNNTYPYRAYLETLLSYGPAVKKSQLTSELFYKNEPEKMDDANPLDANANGGLKKRHAFFATGGVTDLIGPLHSDIVFQEKFLPSDVGIKIRLVRSKNSFCLQSDTPQATFKVKLHDVKLFIRKVKLSPSVFIAQAKAFEIGTAKYPIKRVVCKSFTVSRGNLDFSQESLFTGQLPCKLILGIVDNTAFNGAYDHNPFFFKNYNLTQVKVLLDGISFSCLPIDVNYQNNQTILGYMSLFAATGKLLKDEGNDITRDDYANGFSLYGFDLSADQNEDDHLNLARDGSLRVDLKFATPLPNTINVICYAAFENIMEIHRNKNIIFDYNN